MATSQPLAARMRPSSLDDIVGQRHLLFPGSPLERLAAPGNPAAAAVSVLLYGPPGTGKTSIANVVARQTGQHFVELSATSAGVAEVRKQIANAKKRLEEQQEQTLVFIDEIHRFSKAQQDVLLPAVENGEISLIGATTENPSFAVNAALVSRSTLLVLRQLTDEDLFELLQRALATDAVLQQHRITADVDTVRIIAQLSTGDARQSLNRLEAAASTAVATNTTHIDRSLLEQITGTALQRYDRDGDQHYDVISAFIKSMRGSDPDATLHWLARMIEAGEDPRFIARRLVVHASEDVGMADPSVLGICVAAAQAVQLIGMPEARLNLAQAAIAIATAPKSPGVIQGIDRALADVQAGRTGEVPAHLRDAHYPGAKALGHGRDYLFPHDFEHSIVAQQYLPERMRGSRYYQPSTHGFERTIHNRLLNINQILHPPNPDGTP